MDHLRGAHELAPARDSISYSVITRCELFAGAKEQETAVELLLSPFSELPVDRRDFDRVPRLRTRAPR